MSAEIVESSFKVAQDACYYSFDKLTPLKLLRGGGGSKLRRFPVKEQANISETCDPSPAAAADGSIWLCWEFSSTF